MIFFLAAGLLLRLATGLAFENVLYPDEIFQTVEQAHRLAFGVGIVPWEFQFGFRSYLFPGFLALWLIPFRFLPVPSSFSYIATVKVVLCLFSGSLIYFAYRYGREFGARYAGLLAPLFAAFWYELVYFAPKALHALMATYFILPGLFYAELAAKNNEGKKAALAGALLSLGAALRIHYGAAWLVPLVGFAFNDRRARKWDLTVHFLAASGAVLAAYGFIDWLAWGRPFQEPFAQLYGNLAGAVIHSETLPPHWYLNILWNNQGVILLAGLLGGALACRRIKMTGLAVLAVFLLHCLTPHKQLRFIFIVLPTLLIFAALGLDLLLDRVRQRQLRLALLAAAVACFLAVSVHYVPGYTLGRLGYFPGSPLGRQAAWTAFQDNLVAYRFLSARRDVWGLQDNVTGWAYSGGYYYLHHNVPIYNLPGLTPVDIAGNRHANYLLTRARIAQPGLELVRDQNGLYIYKKTFLARPEPDPGYSTRR